MSRELGLPEAARRLRLSYSRTYNLILRGLLDARQDEIGRWKVSAVDVEKMEAKSSGSARHLTDQTDPQAETLK